MKKVFLLSVLCMASFFFSMASGTPISKDVVVHVMFENPVDILTADVLFDEGFVQDVQIDYPKRHYSSTGEFIGISYSIKTTEDYIRNRWDNAEDGCVLVEKDYNSTGYHYQLRILRQ